MILRFAILFLLSALVSIAPARADLLNVSSPNIAEGAFDLNIGTALEDNASENGNLYLENDLEADYSPLSWWKTGLEFGAEREAGDHYRYTSTAWKNTFRFMQQAAGLPVTAALRVEYEKAHLRAGADAVKTRLLMQRTAGKLSALVNIGLSREIGNNRNAVVEGDLRGSLRYKINDYIRPSIDYLGDTGSLHELDYIHRQDHRLGPAIQGELGNGLNYEVGYLVGLTENAPDHSIKLNLGYGFN